MSSRQDEIRELETVNKENKILITKYKNDIKLLKSKLKDKEELLKCYKKSSNEKVVYIEDLFAMIRSYSNTTGYSVSFKFFPKLNFFTLEVKDPKKKLLKELGIDFESDHTIDLNNEIEFALRECGRILKHGDNKEKKKCQKKNKK